MIILQCINYMLMNQNIYIIANLIFFFLILKIILVIIDFVVIRTICLRFISANMFKFVCKYIQLKSG